MLKNLARKETSNGDNVLWSGVPVASGCAQADLFLSAFSQSDPLAPIPYNLRDGNAGLEASFTLNELLLAIQKTLRTTPARDGISVKPHQDLSRENTEKLLALYNVLFDSDTAPLSWKEATIVSICKPAKLTRLASYNHHIALTAVCSKVSERLLLHSLIFWAGNNDIFYDSHYGFEPFKDTTTALCKFFAISAELAFPVRPRLRCVWTSFQHMIISGSMA